MFRRAPLNVSPVAPENPRVRLSIVIPAFNEEAAIGKTVRSCLEARARIQAEAGLDAVDVIVVDDGSSDRTAAIVREIPDAQLVQHGVNKGYGVAIKTGFAAARGELLSFLDADGTCDPLLLGRLAKTLVEQQADVVSGNRLAPGNHMPPIRRLGNRMFATMINVVAPQHVTDLASGMRVMRRDALPKLAPLPDGMHFTPAMSAKAVFDQSLKLVEVPIPYAERIGTSKLSVLKDGQRFLRVLGEIALSYRPFAFFGAPGLLCLVIGALYSIQPIRHLVDTGTLPADAIYRVFTIVVLTVTGITLLGTGLVAEAATAILHGRRGPPHALHRICDAILLSHPFTLGTLSGIAAIVLNRHAIATYLEYRRIDDPWIHIAVGGLLVLLAATLYALGALKKILLMLADRRIARDEALKAKAS